MSHSQVYEPEEDLQDSSDTASLKDEKLKDNDDLEPLLAQSVPLAISKA